MDTTLTIRLDHPVKFGESLIEELVFRPGVFGDLEDIVLHEGLSMNDSMLIVSRMCGQHLKVIKALRASDIAKVMPLAGNFFRESLAIGSGA